MMLKTADNPEGLPIDVFDGIRAGVRSDRSQFYKDLSAPFYGANREGSQVSQGVRDAFWLMSMQAGMPAAYDCIKAFSETDFRQELPKIDVPTLVIHGDADTLVTPSGGRRTAELVPGAELLVVEGMGHDLPPALWPQVVEAITAHTRRASSSGGAM
jgi:non-heme chloroperoxidase